MEVNGSAPSRVEEVFKRIGKLFPTDKVHEGLGSKLDESAILLSVGSKSGTTWAQQILHGLRTGGSMDYDDINEAVPFLEIVALTVNGEDKAQLGEPPMYKTHMAPEDCPSATKIVVITRDVKDAAFSLYRYLLNWVFEAEELTLDEFIEWYYVYDPKSDAYAMKVHQMHHLAGWYPRRKDENVLWLHYEDLKSDLKKCIKLISDFTNLGVGDQDLLDLVEQQASLDFMKKHDSKFDSHAFKLARNEAAGLKRDAGLDKSKNSGKVRTGKVNESKEELSKKAHDILDRMWNEMLKPVTGYNSYSEMREAINNELGRSFSA